MKNQPSRWQRLKVLPLLSLLALVAGTVAAFIVPALMLPLLVAAVVLAILSDKDRS